MLARKSTKVGADISSPPPDLNAVQAPPAFPNVVVVSSANVSSHTQYKSCSVAVDDSPLFTFKPECCGIPALPDIFLFNSIILSSTESVVVLTIVVVPVTSRFPSIAVLPVNLISPVDPVISIGVFVAPPSLIVILKSPSEVTLANVKLSPDIFIVISELAPIVIPSSFKTPNVPDVVSLLLDLR